MSETIYNGLMDKISHVLAAQLKAELEGEKEFTCPLCQGTAKWTRAEINKHLWIKCNDCGFKFYE